MAETENVLAFAYPELTVRCPHVSTLLARSSLAIADVFCLSVVDHDVLTKDELLYLLSEYTGGYPGAEERFVDHIKTLTNLWAELTPVNTVRLSAAAIPEAELQLIPSLPWPGKKVVFGLPASAEVLQQ